MKGSGGGRGADTVIAQLEGQLRANAYFHEVAVFEQRGQFLALVRPNIRGIHQGGTWDVKGAVRTFVADAMRVVPVGKRVSDYVILQTPLPRKVNGEIDRERLAEVYDHARSGAQRALIFDQATKDQSLPANPKAQRVWRWLMERFDERILLDDFPQIAPGLDSLDWLTVILKLESDLRVTLSDAALRRIITLRDLVEEASVAISTDSRRESAFVNLAPDAETLQWLSPPPFPFMMLGALLHFAIRRFFSLWFGLTVVGLDNLPENGAVIIAANHVSDLDVAAILAALPYRRLLRTNWGANPARLFRTRVMRMLSRSGNVYPLDDRAPRSGLAAALMVLRDGRTQVWFPEAWRSPDGSLQPFLRGIGVIAHESGAPLVPTCCCGTFVALPRWKRWPKRRQIKVIFGKPIMPADLNAAGIGSHPYTRITNALRDLMLRQHQEWRP
jgi:long-chain acyl-CoA synthetase